MKLTAREKLQLTSKKIKTTGHYGFPLDEYRERENVCRCWPEDRIGHWPKNCQNCGRKIGI
jgi:hypothetical protein